MNAIGAISPVVAAAGRRLSRKRVVVICGGVSSEHEVSLASGLAITKAAEELGHDVARCVIGTNGEWLAGEEKGFDAAVRLLTACDVAVPALHGKGGEDGTVQGLLQVLGVPFVGSGVRASAVGLNKRLTKLLLAAEGMPVAPGVTVRADEGFGETELLEAGLSYPVFVKPVNGGSSVGVTRAADGRSLAVAIRVAGAIASQVLVEQEIRGREVDVAVIELPDGGLHAAPALEIHSDPGQPFFNVAAKYDSTATRFEVPAPLVPGLARDLQVNAIQTFEALDCSGLARVDFFLPEQGPPVVNEVNTFPGFTLASQYPQMWAAEGLDYLDVVNILLATALS